MKKQLIENEIKSNVDEVRNEKENEVKVQNTRNDFTDEQWELEMRSYASVDVSAFCGLWV